MDDELLECCSPPSRREETRTEESGGKSVAMSTPRSGLCISLIATGFLAIPSRAAQKDYLSSLESDKIRDADGTNERIKLFLSFP